MPIQCWDRVHVLKGSTCSTPLLKHISHTLCKAFSPHCGVGFEWLYRSAFVRRQVKNRRRWHLRGAEAHIFIVGQRIAGLELDLLVGIRGAPAVADALQVQLLLDAHLPNDVHLPQHGTQ